MNNPINNDKNNDNNDKKNDNGSLYDNLNMYIQQENIYIKYIYYTNYLTHKKKIFPSISNNYNLILGLFDDVVCEILINIYILKKKNKISEKHFEIFKYMFDYVNKLNDTNYIDQENFFVILIDFYKINILSVWVGLFFSNHMFRELIDYQLLINKINDLYLILEKNTIFGLFNDLNVNVGDENYLKEKIIQLAQKLSFDLFIFYDSERIFNEITGSFVFFNTIMSIDDNYNLTNMIDENLSLIVKKNNLLYGVFEKNKSLFVKEYNKNKIKCDEIYSNDIELFVKFKINKSPIINKFIKNITYIDNI